MSVFVRVHVCGTDIKELPQSVTCKLLIGSTAAAGIPMCAIAITKSYGVLNISSPIALLPRSIDKLFEIPAICLA